MTTCVRSDIDYMCVYHIHEILMSNKVTISHYDR